MSPFYVCTEVFKDINPGGILIKEIQYFIDEKGIFDANVSYDSKFMLTLVLNHYSL